MPVWLKLIEPIECLMACHAETVDRKPPNAKWQNSSIQRDLPIDAKATIKAQLSSPSRALAAIFRSLPGVVLTSMKASWMEASLFGGRVRIFLLFHHSRSRETLCQEPNPPAEPSLTQRDGPKGRALVRTFFVLCVKRAPYSHQDTSGLPEDLDPYAGTQLLG